MARRAVRRRLELPEGDTAGPGEDQVGQASGAAAASGVAAVVEQDAVAGAQVGDVGQLSTLDTHGASVPGLDFDDLFRRYHARMLQQALGMLQLHVPTAEDAVGEAWVKAWAQRHEYRDNGHGPLPWLITLVKWSVLAQVREHYRHLADNVDWLADELGEVDRGTGYPGLEDPETHRRWAQVVPMMSQQQAVAVWLRCIGGYTPDEAAREMRVSRSVAQNAAEDGLRKIRRFFHGDGYEFTNGCKRCGWPRASIGHRTACGRTDRHNRPAR
jgi:DNA-directed RNA polymerase specialized sigma24 family protein